MNLSTTIADTQEELRFPVLSAALICAAIFFAEHLPTDVMHEGRVDQATLLRGNLGHELSYLLLGSFGLFWLTRHQRRTILWNSKLVGAFIALLAWCLLSASWADEPWVSVRRFIAYSLMCLGALGAAACWPRRSIAGFIASSSAIHLTIGVALEVAASHFTPWQAGYRFAGTLPWNEEGFCCVIMALASLAAIDMAARFGWVFRLLFFYSLPFVVLTKSRSCLAVLIIGVAIYFALTKSPRFNTGFLLGLTLSGMLLYLSGVLDRVIEVISRQGEGAEDLTGRVPLWEECMDFVRTHPIGGYGYEDFWTVPHLDHFASKFQWNVSAAHSGYIEMLLTTGSVGLFLQVLFLLFALWRAGALYRRTHNPLFALAICFDVLYMLLGGLETVMITKLSPYSFYFSLLLAVLCLSDTREGFPSRPSVCRQEGHGPPQREAMEATSSR